MRIVFLDLETSGLNPAVNQILEVAMVPVSSGLILTKEVDHFYIRHPRVTYDTDALKKFGTRLDYKPGIPVLDPREAADRIAHNFRRFTIYDGKRKPNCPHLGGKNIGSFDLQFLRAMEDTLAKMVKHRAIDLGNLFHWHTDEELPTLDECLKRGKSLGINTTHEVTHTALDDAMVCAQLYCGLMKWRRKGGDYTPNTDIYHAP
jgi:DNA polymerase III epsilon subunit-like protein